MTWVLKVLAGQFGGWILGGIAGVVLAVVGGLWLSNAGLKHDLKVANGKLALSQADLSMCRLNNSTLAAGIASQNAAVKRLGEEAAARSKVAERAVRDARTQGESYRQAAERVRRQVPREACGDDLITDSLR